MEVRPLGENLLVEVLVEEKTSGGIILAEKKEQNIGKIVEAGEDSSLKKGQSVVFSQFSGQEIILDGKKHLLLTPKDVLALVI